MILTAVNPSTKSKTCSITTLFTTNPILIGLELNSGLYNERSSTNCLGCMAYFISTNLKLPSHAVYRSEGIYMLSIWIHILYLYMNYILKMDGSHCKISGGTSQYMDKFGFIVTASQTLQSIHIWVIVSSWCLRNVTKFSEVQLSSSFIHNLSYKTI